MSELTECHMQYDSGMSDEPFLTSCRCQAVSRMMKMNVVCVVLMSDIT